MVGTTGFEPVASSLSVKCSNQLSYAPRKIKGFSAILLAPLLL